MATKQPVEKILRLGIIQNGRIIEERLLRNREAVTVGQTLKNTFVIASNAFPPAFTMFDVKGGKYVLHFTDKMSGRMLLGSSVHDLESLKRSGKAKKSGSGWTIELSQRARGKVTLGDVTILFQFVKPPPLAVLPQLPANMRGGLLLFVANVMGLSGGFLTSMLFSGIAQIGAVLWLVYMVPPPQRSAGIDAMPDRFVQILEPQPEQEEPPETDPTETDLSEDGEPVEAVEEEEEESNDQPEPTDDEPAGQEDAGEDTRSEDVIREQAQERVRQESALAAFYGGAEDSDGPTLGFTTALTDRRADEVLQSQTALGENAGSGGIVSRSGLATSSGAEGEVGRATVQSGGSRVAEEATTERTEEREAVAVRASVRTNRPQTAGTGELDSNSLRSVLRRRQSDIQRCYERGLASNPELSGRVEIQFTVGRGGAVTEASLRTNELGDAVGSCIVGRVRRWRFDEPQGGPAVVRVPYILEPGE